MKSDTPRTDAEDWQNLDGGRDVDAGFCRKLERELADAIKQRDEAVELYTDLLRRLSGSVSSSPPRAAFLTGDASQKEGGGA
jgi:hypothetical protein